MRLVQEFGEGYSPRGKYSGEVTPLPGCPDVAVSHAVYSHTGPGGGRGKLANAMRSHQIYDLGYSAIVCTAEATNLAQLAILEAEKWQRVARFKSRRTGHALYLYIKEL